MCGICAKLLLSKHGEEETKHFVETAQNIKHRGPDNTKELISKECHLIFHRLAINGLSKTGDQPFEYIFDDKKYQLIVNGEIYNYPELIEEYKLTNPNGSKLDISVISDCYVIGLLYHFLGIDKTAKALKGEFSFVLSEWKGEEFVQFVICRSKYGQRKLVHAQKEDVHYFCSEMAGIVDEKTPMIAPQFEPRTYMTINAKGKCAQTEYYSLESIKTIVTDWNEAVSNVRKLFKQAVSRRYNMVERDKSKKRRIGFLLSGGLDSSIVAAVGAEIAKKRGEKIATFAIGFKDSPDLLAARDVAKHIGSDHTEYVETEETMLALLEKMPLITETYDITTNRASDWQHKLALNIERDFPDIKVIMGGDGADETSCGYRDCYRAPDSKAAHSHTIRRLREIHYYDVTRFDLSVARCGQEARTPHLDDDLVEYILSIDPELRIPMEAKNGEFKGKMEKLIWREAFKDYLPPSIVYRRKEAFSDGVSLLDRSWFVIVREHFDKIISDKEFEENKDKFKYCPPTTKEAYHYRKVFESRFGKENERCIPGFWLQEWSPETKGDPSARTMSIY